MQFKLCFATRIAKHSCAEHGSNAGSTTVKSLRKRYLKFILEFEMIKNTRIRRASAVIMILLGAMLMLLAPEVWPGALLFVSGVVLELAGIALERKAK